MPKLLSEAEVAAFWRDGFHFPLRVLTEMVCSQSTNSA